jgi:RimJ/RimL family protein N-acetyltransferase
MNIDAADENNRFFTVRVMSEAALLDEMPEIEGDHGVSLTPLLPSDDEIYARLCKDEDTNRYWGYDYSQDEPNPTDSYFRENVEGEFYRGISVCLAVRVNEVFAGEAILYSFDLLGGCECAVRLLPAFRRKGYATESLEMLKELARHMGLTSLSATVSKENNASIHMTGKCLPEVESDDKNVRFRAEL